jgi:HlyD family secretion protein
MTEPETSPVEPANNSRGKAATKSRTVIKRSLQGLFALGAVALIAVLAQPKPLPVEVAPVEAGELVVTVAEDGRARLKDRYVVSTPLAGNLARIELHAGDAVVANQVLARLVPLRSPLLDGRTRNEAEARVAMAQASVRQVDAQIERVKAAHAFAEKDAQRTQQLFSQGSISNLEVERSQLELRSREAELTSAQFGSKVASHELSMARAVLGQITGPESARTASFEIPSPSAGRILKVLHESEGVVQPGAALLELGDPGALEIVVDVLTKDAVRIKPGLPATITEWGGAPLTAVVRLVEPSAFTRLSSLGVEEQRVNVVLELSGPPDSFRALGDGYRVDVAIEVERAKTALLVPASALFRRGAEWAAFVVDGKHARLRKLGVGSRNERVVDVTSGLSAGDRVIVHPSEKVTDGVEVVHP